MPYYSQFSEDRWIFENLKLDCFPTFCEVGAYDGIASSNTLFFEQDLRWHGLCIEADHEMSRACMVNRKCPTVCVVAAAERGPITFHTHLSDRGQSGVLAKGSPVSHWGVRLDKLLDAFGLTELGLLSIDTEGTELEVWKGIGHIRPHIVILEYLSGDGVDRSREIHERMQISRYFQVHRTQANLIFVAEPLRPE